MNDRIAVLSLVVAALAVFVGPWVSWLVMKRQIDSAQHVALMQLLAPMRQAWINELRGLLAEMLSAALHYHVAGFQDREDAEYRRLGELEQRIELMLNPNEEQHRELVAAIRSMSEALSFRRDPEQFQRSHIRANELAKSVLKTEWNRAKTGQ